MGDFDPEETAADGAQIDLSNSTDSPPKATLGDRIMRYSQLKKNQRRIASYLGNLGEQDAATIASRMYDCGLFLTFRDYYTVERVLLTRACFCKKHTLCQLCAVRRSAKFLEATLPKFEHLIEESPVPLYPHLIVLTIKNGDDLGERLRHLEKSWQKLLRRRSNERSYPETLLRGVIGGILSIEVTNTGNGWHPHANVMVLSKSKSFDWQRAKDEWLEITGDSSVVNFSEDEATLAATLAETVKYITKFSDLTPAQLWQLHGCVKRRKLTRGFGQLWGLKMPDKLTDDVLSGDLPYIEYVCRYLGRDGYTILQTLSCAAGAEATTSP